MTSSTDSPQLGLVLYADGSFLPGRGGWGLHGYLFEPDALKRKPKGKYLPTAQGYQMVTVDETVTPVTYIDSYGRVHGDKPTNNTAELEAVIQAIFLAMQHPVKHMHLMSDSEYVRKGLTRHVKTWVKNGWTKADGEPVANQSFWKRLLAAEAELIESGRTMELVWVKAHAGEPGNEYADGNAKTGAKSQRDRVYHENTAEEYAKAPEEANPLTMKTRMLFNLGNTPSESTDGSRHYYQYQLGRMQTYGMKQHDTVIDRHNKSDLLLGRRIADATFCVLRVNEPDPFLESVIDLHAEHHRKDVVELAVARLDNAYRSSIRQRHVQLGDDFFIPRKLNSSMVTYNEDLITKTLDPPRLAREAVGQFAVMQERLTNHLAGTSGKGITECVITEQLYKEDPDAKKQKVTLLKHITNNLHFLEVPVSIHNQTIPVRLVLGVDLPQRNNLAKIATLSPEVTLLIVATGPKAYSFAVAFKTDGGDAIYQSPYTQFVLPKT